MALETFCCTQRSVQIGDKVVTSWKYANIDYMHCTHVQHFCTYIYIYVYSYVYYVKLNMLLLFIYNYILYTHLNIETYTPIFTLNNHVYIKNTLYLKTCV